MPLARRDGPGTERLLRSVGIARGMRIADIGCGVGTVSLWMASQVGPSGAVACIDNSHEQIESARRIAQECGQSNLTFLVASADAVNLPDASLDIVYCRFLLDHLPHPEAALAEMRRLLRPQGALVTETIDLSGLATDPHDPAYDQEIRHMREVNAKRGVDGASGMKVHRLFRNAGFGNIQVSLHQPAYLSGEEKRFWEYSVAESAAAFVARGFYTEEEMTLRVQAMQRVNLDETGAMIESCV